MKSPRKGPARRPQREVGYGKPPKEHQFKPGRSGNPKGRPRGAKSPAAIIRELMIRKIEVRERGVLRKVSVFEAMLLRIFENALKGDPKAAGFLIKLYDQVNTSEAAGPDSLPEHDRKILEEFTKSILKNKGRL